jgi:hypothetical protein
MKIITAIETAHDLSTRIAHASDLAGLDLAIHTLERIEDKHGVKLEISSAIDILTRYYNQETECDGETHGY